MTDSYQLQKLSAGEAFSRLYKGKSLMENQFVIGGTTVSSNTTRKAKGKNKNNTDKNLSS